MEDERYTGVYVIGKRAVLEVGGTRSRLKDRESWYIIPDHHPAIVEKAVFDTVQASQLRFSQPNKKKRDYPLKGKAFCGCCGHALSRTMQKTSYYHCRHSEADVESRCHKMRLNAAELEQAVFLTLKKQMEAVEKALTLSKDKCQKLFESSITTFQGYLDDANLCITNCGTRSSKLELIENRMKSQKTTFETLKSENEDIDVTETAINLKSAEMTYEAALMATGKVMQTTLLNFI